MSEGKGKKAIQEPESKSTKFVAFNATPVYGSANNLRVTTKDFVLHTQVMLAVQGFLWQRAAELSIKKLIIVWCPLVEPGVLSSVRIDVKYDIGESETDLIQDEIMVRVCGKVSEKISVAICPTSVMVKDHDKAFYNPWSIDIDVDDSNDLARRHIVGVLKVWCHLKIKTFLSHNRMTIKEYISPEVQWTNVHYPYYVPFFVIKKVRGLASVLWRDTQQYKSFLEDVIRHVDTRTICPDDHLMIMQTMSHEDYNNFSNIVKGCHITKGGTCTCGNLPTQFISSVKLNNTGRNIEHGKLYDNVARSIITGKTKGIPDIPYIKF